MTQEEFQAAIDPLPDHKYFKFVPSDSSLGQYAFCRAYISFSKQEDIILFRDKFDGYVFVDLKGDDYPAIVEFAPNQKIPRKRPTTGLKKDVKSGTIEKDPAYLKFLEGLKEPKTEANLPSAEVYLQEMEARQKELRANHGCPKITTPLIEFIKEKKKMEKARQRDDRKDFKKQQKQIMTKKMPEKDERDVHPNRAKQNQKFPKEFKKDHESNDRKKNQTEPNQRPQTDNQKNEGQEKRGPRDRRDRDKKKKQWNDGNNGDAPKVKVLQKAPSDTPKEVVKPKPTPGKFEGSSSKQELIRNNDDKKVQVNSGKEAESSSATHHKPSQRSDAGEKRSDERRERRREPKERIKNKDRPAIQIYRPGAKKPTERDPTDNEEPHERSDHVEKKREEKSSEEKKSQPKESEESRGPRGPPFSAQKPSQDGKRDGKIRPMVFRNKNRSNPWSTS